MATIKSYTDLEQSKKLEEILPIESADMGYLWNGTSFCKYPVGKQTIFNRTENIPCWSLTALLNAIPSSTLDSSDSHHYRIRCNERYSEWYNNSIDTCYNMILRLHELNIL